MFFSSKHHKNIYRNHPKKRKMKGEIFMFNIFSEVPCIFHELPDSLGYLFSSNFPEKNPWRKVCFSLCTTEKRKTKNRKPEAQIIVFSRMIVIFSIYPNALDLLWMKTFWMKTCFCRPFPFFSPLKLFTMTVSSNFNVK